MINIKSNYLKKITIPIVLTLLLAILTTGCQSEIIDDMPESGIKELVHLYGTEKPDGETAFITSEYLVVENKENKTKYSLPEEEFFVSIAPYTINTHP